MRTAVRLALAAMVLLIAYLASWPVPIRPVAWTAPKAPAAEGLLAPNRKLANVELLAREVALGPEGTAIRADGHVFTGTRDGRILEIDPATGAVRTAAETGGRPIGMAFDAFGRLFVCDAKKGLLALGAGGDLTTLATEQGGLPFRFTNDVDVAPDGTVYFTDTSSRFGIDAVREEILDHAGRGRLLAYHPETRTTELLLSGLQFANGVAVSGDGSYVLVNETGAYRITRYWLAGPKRRTSEPFLENLPGLPDNITFSPARRAFWVALFSPRVPALDVMAPHPFLRKLVYRLPMFVQPQPARHAFLLAVDEQGRIVGNLQDPSPDSYAPVTSARERDGWLWLGSLERDGVGRIAAPPLSPPDAAKP